MSLEKIKEKINKETEEQINALAKQYEETREQIRKSHKARLEKELSRIKEEAKSRVAKMRRSAQLQMEMKKKIRLLEAKSRVLSEIFSETKEDIIDKHLKDIYEVLLQKIAAFSGSNQTKVVVSRDDRDLVEGIISNKKLGLRIEVDNSLSKGNGITAEFEDFSVDYTLPNIFDNFVSGELEEISKLIG